MHRPTMPSYGHNRIGPQAGVYVSGLVGIYSEQPREEQSRKTPPVPDRAASFFAPQVSASSRYTVSDASRQYLCYVQHNIDRLFFFLVQCVYEYPETLYCRAIAVDD